MHFCYACNMMSINNMLARKRIAGWSIAKQIFVDIVNSIQFLSKIYNEHFDQKSYSQYGEDKVLRVLLPERFGTYIDIGSGHPRYNSNTYWFYRRGWRGILVEPLQSLEKMSRRLRPRDSLIRSMVGEKGNHVFWEFIPSEYSTSDSTQAEKCLARDVQLVKKYNVTSFPLSEIAPSMDPSAPTLIDIDVEGTDIDVLRSNDWIRTKPRVVVVEDRQVFDEGDSEVAKFLLEKGYILISVIVQTCIYVHSTYDLGWDE
jgi:FkbM family methyltransferase